MLILPIINRKRVMNVQIKLKDASMIREGVSYEDAIESDIIVNREKFSESSFKDEKKENAPTEFIRSRSMLYPRKYLVTTKEEVDTSLYNVYEVAPPPKKVNDSLDRLYGKAITDLRKEIPGVDKRGRYVSFDDLGIGDHLTDDKIAKLQRIVSEERNQSVWPKLFEEAGISDLMDTIDFINHFECTILSNTSISEDSLQDTMTALSAIHTRDYKNLKRYYKMAKSNTDIYTKISYIYNIIYRKPLTIMVNDKAKKLIKKKEENEY